MDSVEEIRRALAKFSAERDWDQFHAPRNLILALTGEVGELAEIAQWRTDDELLSERTDELEAQVANELADIAIYLIRLSDQLDIDLGDAIERKIEENRYRYEAETFKGSTKKAPHS